MILISGRVMVDRIEVNRPVDIVFAFSDGGFGGDSVRRDCCILLPNAATYHYVKPIGRNRVKPATCHETKPPPLSDIG